MSDQNCLPTERYRPNEAILLLDKKGKLLICERIEAKGAWQFPQGGVDAGEDFISALHREVWEEIGLDPEDYEMIDQRGGYKYKYPPGVREKKKKSGSEGSNDRESEKETEEARKKQLLLFQRVSEAYGVLSDPELRRRYDSEGHAFFSASRTSSNHTSEEKEYEHYLRRFRELVVLTPQGLDLEF